MNHMMVGVYAPLLLLCFAHSCVGVQPGQAVQRTVRLSECSIFYQTVVADSKSSGRLQEKVAPRVANVEAMLSKHKQIRRFGNLHWMRDWDKVGPLFRALGMHTSRWLLEGQFTIWANVLMALAWQDGSETPCMIMLEDDVVLPENFEDALAGQHIDPQSEEMAQFLDWGEGYVFSLGAARKLRDRIYEVGIANEEGNGCAIDSYIIGFMRPKKVDVGVTLLGDKHNGGTNVWGSPYHPARFEQDLPAVAGSTKDGKQSWQQFASLAGQHHGEFIDLAWLAQDFIGGANRASDHTPWSASSPARHLRVRRGLSSEQLQ